MDEERDKVVQQVVGQSLGVAFARRGRDVQIAFDALVETCRGRREEWLTFVRLSVGNLFALAGTATALRAILDDATPLQTLEKLRDDLQPCLRAPPNPTSTHRMLRRALAETRDAIERFNRRWRIFVAKLDLSHVNALRERYNRYYLLEKECALGSSRVASIGFQKLPPLQPEDILALMPTLPVP
jgi:hypothetical protein